MATELIARFLSDEDVRMIHSISIVSREDILCLSFEVNRGNSKYNDIWTIPFAPNSPVKIDDIILPEQVVFVSIPNKIGKYAWRFGDQFSIEYYPYDSYTSRILRGILNREDYYKEIEEEKRKKEAKRQEDIKRQEEELNQKGSWLDDKLPPVIGIIIGLLFLFSIVYFGGIKGEEGFFEIFLLTIFSLFLVPLLLLCKRIWEKLNLYSVGICIALSITMTIFTMRGINKLVNGDVHIEHVRSSPRNSSSNHGAIGFDPLPDENVDVYVTRYGNCYHSTRNCYEITKSKHISKISKKKARRMHYAPCSVCYGTN